MDVVWIVLIAIAVIVALWLWKRMRGRGEGESERALEELDTLAAWEPQATRVLTSPERVAYAIAIRALPEYMILAQVPLARFLKVPTRHSYSEWLHRVGQLCADLVVCDAASQVIAVINVRPPADKTSERAQKRQRRMRRVLKAAGIPMHSWTENMLPTPDEARAAIIPPKPQAAANPGAPVAPVSTKPATKWPPELDLPEVEEEVVALREPPPSTWFDNLDSSPAPLRSAPAAKPPLR